MQRRQREAASVPGRDRRRRGAGGRSGTGLPRVSLVAAVLLYGALAILYSFPLMTSPTTQLPGEYFDIWGTLWTGEWFHRALLEQGRSPLFCPDVGYPFGLSMRLVDSWVWALAAVPLVAVFGPVLALNLFVLGSLSFSATALFALARDRGASAPSALVAGTLLLASAGNFALFAEGAVYLLMSGWIALTAMYLLRVLEGRGARSWIGAALSLALACYTSGYVGACAVVVAGTLLATAWSRLRDRATARRLAQAGLLTALLLAPLVWANLSALAGGGVSSDPFAETSSERIQRGRSEWLADVPRDSASLSSLFTPPAVRRSEAPTPRERTSYLGFLPVVLAAVGLTALGAAGRRRWSALFGVALVLLLGPVFQLQPTPFNEPVPSFPPLPMAVFYKFVPGAEVLRFPYRFQSVAMLALAIPMARGIDVLGRRSGRPLAVAVALAVVAEVLLVGGGPLRKPVQSLEVSPAYERIAAAPDDGAVLELGNPGQRWRDPRLMYQTVHGRPIVGEFPMYMDLSTTRLFQALVLQRLRYTRSGGQAGLTPEGFRQVIVGLGFSWIVHDQRSFVQDAALTPSHRATWTDGVQTVLTTDFGHGQYFEPGITLYRVPDAGPRVLLPRPDEAQLARLAGGELYAVLGELYAEVRR